MAAAGDDPAAAVEVLPRLGRDDTAEARQVLELVRQGLDRGERVAVLVRARSHLGSILPALRAAGIRYLAQDVDLLAERSVARDLVVLTRALLHAGDRLAWLSVLRAPWCGLLLGDLERLVGDQSRATVPGLLADPLRLERLSADGRLRAMRTFAVLQRARGQRGRLGLRRLVEGCWLALGGPACYAAADLDDAAQVFELLSRLDAGGDLDPLEALEEGLQRLYAAPDGTADGRLQVMTIHKAKGLEFDTVILPGLGLRARSGEAPLLRWLELPGAGLLLAPIPRKAAGGDAIYAAIGALEKDRQALETVRLLYVAATRARRRLFLLGHCDATAAGHHAAPAGSLLEVLWPALGEEFSAGEPPAAAPAAPPAPTAELRRLPADWVLPPLGAAPLPPSPEILRPSQQGPAGAVPAAHFTAAGWTARATGTVLHVLLERICREGLESWSPARIAGLEEELRRRLQRLGVASEELAAAMHRVLAGLATAVSGPNGRWILAGHAGAAAELALIGPQVAAVVDRTFVDGEERRWVVDYKTSEPRPGESQEAFFAGESDRYRPQLAGYAQLLKAIEPQREVRGGLYFPLFDGWCEVPL